jgi:hypothetical protein
MIHVFSHNPLPEQQLAFIWPIWKLALFRTTGPQLPNDGSRKLALFCIIGRAEARESLGVPPAGADLRLTGDDQTPQIDYLPAFLMKRGNHEIRTSKLETGQALRCRKP